MGEGALTCFMCKGENTIVGASSPWPTTWKKPLVSQCTRRLYLMVVVLYPRNGHKLPFVAPHEHGELLRGGEKVLPSIYKSKKNQNKKFQII
jgi:hypothetical protein